MLTNQISNNHPSVAMRIFSVRYRITPSESDTPRDKNVCEYLKDFNFLSKPNQVIQDLLDHPDLTVAEALQKIGFGYWEANQANLEAVTDMHHHAYICRDFSLMICGWSCCQAFANVFDFIDSKLYENYYPEHPIHELVWKVKRRFSLEHVFHWATKCPADSPKILPSTSSAL